MNPIEFSGPCVPTSIEFQVINLLKIWRTKQCFIQINIAFDRIQNLNWKVIDGDWPFHFSLISPQVAGKIIASTNKSLFDNNHWILFSYVKGLTLTGSGTIDGQGAGSWQDRTGVAVSRKRFHYFSIAFARIENVILKSKSYTWLNNATNSKISHVLGQALKFYTCPDLVLQGLTHINPQKAHIILTKCDGANINSITITAPEDAPNTDGIDIASSNHVQVQNSKIGTGTFFRFVLALQLHTFSCML